MCSPFAIDTRHFEKYKHAAAMLRVGVLADVLVCDTVANAMVQRVIVAVENNDSLEVRRWSKSMLDYLDIKYPETELNVKHILKELVDLK